jgi:transcriptional regulator with XRE-family HTH domain
MTLVFTLKETIEREGITKNRLSVASGVRNNTIADICNGDAVSLNVNTLDALLKGLNELTGKQYGLDAIVVYKPVETS